MSIRPTLRALALIVAVTMGSAACDAVAPASSTPDASDGAAEPSAPAATQVPGLPAFEGRLRDATARKGQLIQALGAASAGSASDMRLVVGQMRSWVEGERAWLSANPGEPCFAEATKAFTDAVGSMATAADLFLASVDASPAPSGGGSPAGGPDAAVQALQDASRGLVDAAARAKTARPDCAG